MKAKGVFLIAFVFFLFSREVSAQLFDNDQSVDSLRGSIGPGRAWWDALHYQLEVTPDYFSKTIIGSNTITFEALVPGQKMQIDLQVPMKIDSVVWASGQLPFERNGNAYFITFDEAFNRGETGSIQVYYSGKPREAVQAPWDGGWVWTTDDLGRPWMSVACQGLGASVWYPNKDHQSDEPDSATFSITVPDTLVAVANGILQSTIKKDNGLITYTWNVTNPINNYNIIPYIGKYENWKDVYEGEAGDLLLNFWVLDNHLDEGKEQFQQNLSMLECFEYWFGQYPFYEDGFKMVEAPYLGMEHQSAIAYGNHFMNGYLGHDLSQTGWGLEWDYIIVHEGAHEWFGNNITTQDIADMWVHEGFAMYSEALYTQCQFGIEAGNDYVIGVRAQIQNESPIIGPYGVNQEGSGDMYYKGANIIHLIRQIMNDDDSFRKMLRNMNQNFKHQTVTSNQIENFITEESGHNFELLFEQYLRTPGIPTLEFQYRGNRVRYRWTNCIPGFEMPVKLQDGTWLSPTEKWDSIKRTSEEGFLVDRNFYINTSLVE